MPDKASTVAGGHTATTNSTTDQPTLADDLRALVEAREFAAEFMRSWSKGTAADGYLAGAYDHTHAVQSLAIRLAPPASDAAASGAGFVLVPVEPTEAMLEAAGLVDIEIYPTNIPSGLTATNSKEARAIWVEMLAAAPKVASEAAGLREAVEAGRVVLEGRGTGTYDEAQEAIRALIDAALTHPSPSESATRADHAQGGGEPGEVPCDLHNAFSKWCGHCLDVNGYRGPEDVPTTTATTPGGDLLEQAAKVAEQWAASNYDESSTTMALAIAADIRALSPARDGAGS